MRVDYNARRVRAWNVSGGQLGVVGVLDVDARSGKLFVPKDFTQTVQNRAKLIFTTA